MSTEHIITVQLYEVNSFFIMYKNKFYQRNNIAGIKVAQIRKSLYPKCSQRKLSEMLQLAGHDIDKNAVQKMESGERYITDIELKAISEVLNCSLENLLDTKGIQ